MATKIRICIPYRPDGGHRDRLFEYCVVRWNEMMRGTPICVGNHDGEPLNRARARNVAAEGAWDVAVFSDADNTMLSAKPVLSAIEKAKRTKGMVYAHNVRHGLDEAATEAVLAGKPLNSVPAAESDPNTFSGVWVIHRELWDEIGGFDERFQGWGFEDLCFMHAAGQVGSVNRVPGIVYHLWHPRPEGGDADHPNYKANEFLWLRYLEARGDRDAMLQLIWEDR